MELERAFRRYRLMSFITGSTLLSLFATLLLHQISASAWHHISLLVRIDGIAHGVILFPIYMIASFIFVLKARLSVLYLVIMVLAGFVPFVAFIMEAYMRRKVFPAGVPARTA